jgi:hypothetical protein
MYFQKGDETNYSDKLADAVKLMTPTNEAGISNLSRGIGQHDGFSWSSKASSDI